MDITDPQSLDKMNNIIPFKNRQIDYSRPVYVYRNLHKGKENKVFSIKQNNLIVGHATDLLLKNCEFIINKSGQERTRKEKVKNVHGFIKCYIGQDFEFPDLLGIDFCFKISYNPYKDDYFTGESMDFGEYAKLYIKRAELISIGQDGVFANKIEEH